MSFSLSSDFTFIFSSFELRLAIPSHANSFTKSETLRVLLLPGKGNWELSFISRKAVVLGIVICRYTLRYLPYLSRPAIQLEFPNGAKPAFFCAFIHSVQRS